MAPKRTEWLQFGSGKSYFHRVHRPLQCLVFISPLLLIYQIGSAIHPGLSAQDHENWQVVAFVLMLKFFAFFGAAGNVLPLLAVIAILICWHLARKDPWDFDPPLYTGMAIESIIWGIPFIVIGLAIQRHMPAPAFQTLALNGAAGSGGGALPWQTEVVLSVGAGIYEELLFRLIAINVLSIILMDLLELKPHTAIPIIIVGSALMFSAYHLLGTESFDAGKFAFRSAMGIYLAGIYVYRGFGIAVGTHTVYDLIVVAFVHTH
jgi:hypothetical protein